MPDHLNTQAHPPVFETRPVTLRYLLVLQGLPTLCVLALGIPSYAMFDQPIPWMQMSFVIFLTYLANYPWRFRIIEALFAPVTWLILHFAGHV